MDSVKSTHCNLYGLETNVNHEVRVRCKMHGGKEFGDFSDSIFIFVPSQGKLTVVCTGIDAKSMQRLLERYFIENALKLMLDALQTS